MNNYLAGQTNSPIPIPDGYPHNIVKGSGPYVFDDDGTKYIDMWMGYGALLFGHADPQIIKVINDNISDGWFYSYPTKIEKVVADIVHNNIPSAERVRFATSGSDAVAYAIRASRAYTKRKKVLSINGGYHGVHESMIPSEGTQSSLKPELIAFNNLDEAAKHLKTESYACMILEPILANSGCTPPEENYLQSLRDLCTKTKTVLIFDEVVTGFRTSLGGAQKKFGVTPDLSTFSKAVAGGFPLSMVCGKEEIMENYIPNGKVFFAGTFNGHPISLKIAEHVLGRLEDGEVHKKIYDLGDRLRCFIKQKIEELDLNASVQGYGSMLTIAFGCKSFKSGIKNESFDEKTYNTFITKMSKRKILFPPLPTETVFLSPVHEVVMDEIEKAIGESLAEL